MTELSGGCQCGALRYRAQGFGASSICHCRMCQKAFGNYFAPLVPVEKLEWTRGTRRIFRSSNVSERGFCPDCGTPITLETEGAYELAVATLDQPNKIIPQYHANPADCVMPLRDLANLPSETPERRAENSEWNDKVISFQHPDHDTDNWPIQ